MFNDKNNHEYYYITKIDPDSISEPNVKYDWVLVDWKYCVIDHANNMDELLIKADLRGINKDQISLYANQFTGDISKYLSEDYFSCKDRIAWANL